MEADKVFEMIKNEVTTQVLLVEVAKRINGLLLEKDVNITFNQPQVQVGLPLRKYDRLTQEDKDKIHEISTRGISKSKAARLLGKKESTIWWYIKSHKIKWTPKPPTLTHDQIVDIFKELRSPQGTLPRLTLVKLLAHKHKVKPGIIEGIGSGFFYGNVTGAKYTPKNGAAHDRG